MRQELWATLFVFAMLFTLGLLLVGSPLTGRSVSIVDPICEKDADCSADKVCCLFSGKQMGICDFKDSCSLIKDSSEKDKLPVIQLPAEINPWIFYGILLAIAAGTLIIVVVFYKRLKH